MRIVLEVLQNLALGGVRRRGRRVTVGLVPLMLGGVVAMALLHPEMVFQAEQAATRDLERPEAPPAAPAPAAEPAPTSPLVVAGLAGFALMAAGAAAAWMVWPRDEGDEPTA